jgi:hypothetical protein
VVLGRRSELFEEEFDRAGRVALAAVLGKDVVPDVHLAGLQPVVIVVAVVVDPPDDLTGDDDDRCRARTVASRAQPAPELVVAPRNQDLGIGRRERPDGDGISRNGGSLSGAGSGRSSRTALPSPRALHGRHW